MVLEDLQPKNHHYNGLDQGVGSSLLCIACDKALTFTFGSHSESEMSVLLQVLPPDMIVLAEPRASELVEAVSRAVELLPIIHPDAMHQRVRAFG
jgi:hypothetical protein